MKIVKKYIILPIVPILTLILLQNCNIRKTSKIFDYKDTCHPNCDILYGPDVCLLKTFQGTSISNIYYLSWSVISNSSKYNYVIEKSLDGKHFYPFILKSGNYSPNNNTQILNCVSDTSCKSNIVYYRLKAFPENIEIGDKYKGHQKQLENILTIKLTKQVKNNDYSRNLLSSDK